LHHNIVPELYLSSYKPGEAKKAKNSKKDIKQEH